MAWVQLIWFIVSTIVSIALAPKPKAPTAAALEDFDFPTAEEGRPIPVVFGTVDIQGANCLWTGDLTIKPIKKRSGFSKSTVGYKYSMGFHLGLCHGPVDAITRLEWGEKVVWSGNVTASGNIPVNNTGLWGGDKRGGGVSGVFNVMMGEPDQDGSLYLASRQGTGIDLYPVAYRGFLGIVWEGGYIGTQEQVRILKWRVRRALKGWNTDVWYPERALIDGTHMNPAHVCYQIMTDPEWGMGSPIAFLNDSVWKAAADLFYEEGFGLSMMWTQQVTIEEFLQQMLDHIAASIAFRPGTGMFELTPIRGDYDPDDLITLDPSDIKELIDYQRQGWGETVNEVTLVYTDPETGEDTAISAHDLGNQDAQQRRVPTTVERRGIRQHDIAEQVVARELASRVTPLGRGKIIANRNGWMLPYNGLFKLTWPERQIYNVPHRVLSIDRGTIESNELEIDIIEDIFGYELGAYLSYQPPTTPPTTPDTPEDDPDTGNGVVSVDTTTPPASAYPGDTYYVPDGATDEWAGHEGELADWDDDENDGAGGWVFTPIPDGTIVYDRETQTNYQYIGGELVPFAGADGGYPPQLGHAGL
jgi:hypothetical protein